MSSLPRPIYLDNNATTPLDPDVLQAMMPYLTSSFGNPASAGHLFGWEASEAVERARAVIAKGLNANSPRDIVFTSGATESINQALGAAPPALERGKGHVITSMTEHKAVLDSCAKLASTGTSVTYLPVLADGTLCLDTLRRAIRADTYLVSIMAANNETGTLHNLHAIGSICQERGILLHTDATQAFGKVEFDVQQLNVSMASISAHKIYGPKGVGALYVNIADSRLNLSPLIVGGGHERGLRSGTLNVPGIIGFAHAVELAMSALPTESARLTTLRNTLRQSLLEAIPHTFINGHLTDCLPGVLNVSFANVDATSLLLELPDIAMSSGSACTSAQHNLSHVLLAMGVDEARIRASVRIGIGRFNTQAHIDQLSRRLIEAVGTLRSMVPDASSTCATRVKG